MREKEKAGIVALYGVLIALSMVLSFVESLIPLPIPVPGVKLGLANLVTVAGLYLVGVRGTVFITIVRIILVGLSFGNPFSMIYGLSGSILSLCVMAAAKAGGRFTPPGVSILGGIFHNLGQLAFAAFIVQNPKLFYYFPALLAAGAAAGVVIGILGGIMTERLRKFTKNMK